MSWRIQREVALFSGLHHEHQTLALLFVGNVNGGHVHGSQESLCFAFGQAQIAKAHAVGAIKLDVAFAVAELRGELLHEVARGTLGMHSFHAIQCLARRVAVISIANVGLPAIGDDPMECALVFGAATCLLQRRGRG